MLDVRDQHDAVAGRDAEQRDEADHRGDAQHAAGQEDAGHAANQRQRQVDHDQHRIAGFAERQHQQHEQAGEHADTEDQQPVRGALLALELAAVLDAVADRHRHRLRDRRPDVAITLPRSRPETLHEITMRRCTFSRRIMFGPSSRRTSASSRIGTWPAVGVSTGRSAIRSKSVLLAGSNFTTRSNAVPRSKIRPTIAPAKLVSIASATSSVWRP